MTTKPDELDDILYKYVANRDMYLSDLEDEVITEKDWMRIRDNIQLDTKQAIQAHIDKKVNKVLGELNKEIFFSSANPDGQLVKNLILNKRRTIKKLRSEL